MKQLVNGGRKLVLVSNKVPQIDNKNLKYIRSDRVFLAIPGIINLLKEVALVVNCTRAVSDESKMYKTNAVLVSEIVELIRRLKIPRFIHLGSAGIYQKEGVVRVDSAIQPTNYYEQTKWEADKFIFSLDGEFTTHILRPTTVVGRNMRNQSFIQLLKLIKRIGFINTSDIRENFFHYVPVECVVNTMLLCINGILNERTYLIATDLTQEEFIKYLPYKTKRVYIPSFFLSMVALIKNPFATRERINHLKDRTCFISNIQEMNDPLYKIRMMKDAVLTFNIF